MKSSFLLVLALAVPAFADPAGDEVKAAAKKLADAGNYTWTSTTALPQSNQGNRNFQPGPTTGKINKGLAHLSTTRGDRTSESVVKGGKWASKGDAGWQTGDEIRAAREAGGGGGGQGGGQGRRGGGGFGGGFGRNLDNFKAPAEEVEALVGQVKEFKKEGDAITGVLTDEAIKAALTGPFGGGRRGRDGGEAPSPTNTKGSVKFWLKDGTLAKYETQVSGTMTFGENEREIGSTRTTEIKDVGTTKVDVPEEAVKKLEGTAAPKTEEKKA
jgi:hypothetical protein